jgi:predicted metal-dependent hydrolase
MSAYIIIPRSTPHPLDTVWTFAKERLEVADEAIDALGDDYSDEEIDPLVDVRTLAVASIQALPARNIDDMMFKLNAALGDGDLVGADCSVGAIIDETLALITSSMQPVADVAAWRKVFGAYEIAKAAYEVAEALKPEPGNIDDLVNQMYAAMDRLIDCPAPDHGALVKKIELLRDRYDGSGLPSEDYATFIDDVSRLGGLAVPA